MTAHPLDRPVWHALAGEQAHFALVEGPARRFDPEIGPLAGAPDGSPESLAGLAALISRAGPLATLQVEIDPVPPGTRIVSQAEGVQMVFTGHAGPAADPRIVPLGPEQNAEMVALAALTEPGPFAARTRELGEFWGVFEDGRLAAMAGQRTRFPGFVEVSGVCTHPAFRGRGLAALLTCHVASSVMATGRVPLLHAYAGNSAAIGVYRKIGFTLRARVWLTVLAPEE